MDISKKDWKLFRERLSGWQENYMEDLVKEKDKNKGQDNQAKPKEEQMSKDNAEQLLNAAMQSEKATQQRMKKALQKPSSRRLQKNW